MAVREFKDDSGREWRAWDVKPEDIHPATKAEDYLADCYITGWIVFETKSGDEKRRLCPWPMDWLSASDEELRQLLDQTEVVPSHRVLADRVSRVQSPLPPAEAAELAEIEAPDITDLQVVRSFKYPGGRFWTVLVVMFPEQGGPPVLRFTSGMRSIDLKVWPKDWADQPDEGLVWMLRRAVPRREAPAAPGPDTPRRRWDDPPYPVA